MERLISIIITLKDDAPAQSNTGIFTLPTSLYYISRGVYSQEFVANEEKKGWSWSYKTIFLVILHIQIEEFNYRLLIMLK